MIITNLQVYLPFMILGGTIIILVLVAALRRNHFLTSILAVLALILVLAAVCDTALSGKTLMPDPLHSFLQFDSYGMFFLAFFAFLSLAVLLLAYPYWKNFPGNKEEFYILFLLATGGAMLLALSRHMAPFFIGLEILSVSLIGLMNYGGRKVQLEAAVKYLILASMATAFLLFGMALIYTATGSLYFSRISFLQKDPLILLTGLALMLVGLGFKLAVAPFHLWTADVYHGAPVPVSAFVATVSKGAMAVFLLRWLLNSGFLAQPTAWVILAVMAVASMCVGNWCALWQDDIKRVLAFSSIAHMGYFLVALLLSPGRHEGVVIFYIVAYTISVLGAFAVVSELSSYKNELVKVLDYRGLFWRRPALALVFSIFLLSLAGIPLTAGFLGKFLIFSSGLSQGKVWLLLVMVINSLVGFFYYLRVIITMSHEVETEPEFNPQPLFKPFWVVVILAILIVLVLGSYPGPMLSFIQSMLWK